MPTRRRRALFGFADTEAMKGMRMAELHPPGESRQRALDRIAQLEQLPVGEGVPVRDFDARTIDGRPISVQATGVRVEAAGGPATLTIMFDITARLAAEAALRRSEAMLSQLFATSPDCIALYEADSGRLTLVNAAFSQLTGYAAEEVVGRTADELGLWHDAEGSLPPARRARPRGPHRRDLPARIATRSGRLASVLISAAGFTMDRRDYVVVNARDVTASEQTRLEHAAIFERASIGIALTRDRRFVQANPRFEAIFGWPAGELRDQPGSVVWIDDAEYAEIGKLAGPLLAAGQPFEIEREMRKKDGSRFWCRLLGQAVDPDRPGEGGTIWIADDVTERRRLDAAARRRPRCRRGGEPGQERLPRQHQPRDPHAAERPARPGAPGAGGVAAAGDAPLPPRADPRLRPGPRGDPLRHPRLLEDRGRQVHPRNHRLRPARAAGRGAGVLSADHRCQGPDAGARSRRPGCASVVNGDPVRIRQILGNFITNAVKFTVEGGIRIVAAAGATGGVRLAVVDTGSGVDAQLLPRLFQPFSQGDASTTRARRRHRPGPVDLPPARSADGRRRRRRDRRRRRQHLLGRAAAAAGGAARRCARRARRARTSACATRASCWSRTTR